MSKTKVISKGYTIEVVSWENDGDHYKTIKKTYDDLNEIKFRLDCIKLANEYFEYCNMYEDSPPELEEEDLEEIIKLFKKHNKTVEYNTYEDLQDCFIGLCENFLGNSVEGYVLRVLDKYTITYSPEDFYLETINI